MAKNETPEPNLKHRIIVKYEQMKGHVERNKSIYAFAAGVVVTTATYVVIRRVSTPMFAEKIVIKDSVLLIGTYARKTGPPSWMVRCIENGRVYRSQEHAAKVLKISRGMLTSHLNGRAENVAGYHFERVAIGLPKSG